VKARSVPFLRITWNCADVNICAHSSSVLTTFSIFFDSIFFPSFPFALGGWFGACARQYAPISKQAVKTASTIFFILPPAIITT
jgi:hypothetical protein